MTSKKPKIAIVGATGNVGREVLDIIDEKEVQYSELVALASKKSKGSEIQYGEDKLITVKDLSEYDFNGTDIAIFSAGASVSSDFAPIAAKQGCIVIDNTSHFRTDPDIPLVVSEVNPGDLKNFRNKNIISNPNCSTMGLMVAAKPLHDAFKIKRLVVSTYQSVSGAGKEAADELFNQTKSIYSNEAITKEKFTKQIAFNLIPHIDVFLEDGQTKEEWKMYSETKRIIDPNIEVSCTCVRVPVFVSHSLSVNVEFENSYEEDQVREIFKSAPGLKMVDYRVDEGYVTPVEVAGLDPVYVSRIRRDSSIPNGLNFWCVADNLRKGAALNTVQIAEILIKDYLSS
ncbi:MAG: aspartate-semialdehyde dehydrogenase [Pelagibacteraceae bacterium]|nr:aspartate-semialdehyde dehydrogenase [Pelagibacteraceae bacterium]|tara:strand:- start:9794 stop:10822 length:1029 start_codon:yes stop_codon:yes gene_type:complete